MQLSRVAAPNLQFEIPKALFVDATSDPQDPLLEKFFELYDRAFILPSEKEEWSGFVSCLSLNHDDSYAKLTRVWGPFREWVLLVREVRDDGAVIGGANLICYPLFNLRGSITLSMNLNYLFIAQQYRGRGYLKHVLTACQELVRRSFELPVTTGTARLLTFIEQNDPLKISPEDYLRDSVHAGVDQIDRVRIWQHAGARIIDFPYVQPALSDEQLADTGLMLSVAGATGDVLDACLLGQHLERFFAISVFKGRDPWSNAISRVQLHICEDACRDSRLFAIFDPQCWLGSVRDGPEYGSQREFPSGGLPERLREIYAAKATAALTDRHPGRG